MSAEQEATTNRTVFSAVTDRFDDAIRAALDLEPAYSPITARDRTLEVVRLSQQEGPALSIELSRPLLSLERQQRLVGVEIEYAIPGEENEEEPGSVLDTMVQEFYAFDDGDIDELVWVGNQLHFRHVGNGEKNDILGLIDLAE